MNRPLLVTDCDEVLLLMVSHFRDWLDEAHDVDFAMTTEDWRQALTHRGSGETVAAEEIWPLLDGFFDGEMARQTLVPGVLDALARIAAVADIVVLTNLADCRQGARVAQLEGHGIRHRVICNQGGKGPAMARLLDEVRPSATVFVDDLAVHHASVADAAPHVWRLHMIAEPLVAAARAPAAAAHARIDDWASAADWILARLAEGPAPISTGALTASEHEA